MRLSHQCRVTARVHRAGLEQRTAPPAHPTAHVNAPSAAPDVVETERTSSCDSTSPVRDSGRGEGGAPSGSRTVRLAVRRRAKPKSAVPDRTAHSQDFRRALAQEQGSRSPSPREDALPARRGALSRRPDAGAGAGPEVGGARWRLPGATDPQLQAGAEQLPERRVLPWQRRRPPSSPCLHSGSSLGRPTPRPPRAAEPMRTRAPPPLLRPRRRPGAPRAGAGRAAA